MRLTKEEIIDAEEHLIMELVMKILRGEDENIDYERVDSDDRYDNIEFKIHDEEETFFNDHSIEIVESKTDTGVQDF